MCPCVFKGGGLTAPSVVLTRLLHYACWQPCLSPLKAHLVSPLYLVSPLIELFVWHFPLCRGCYNRKVRAGTTCPADATHTRPPPERRRPLFDLITALDSGGAGLLCTWLPLSESFIRTGRSLSCVGTSTSGLKGFHTLVIWSDSP